jgi:hypothetical protein
MNARRFGRRPVEVLGRELVLVPDELDEIAPEPTDHSAVKDRIRTELMARINPGAAGRMLPRQLRAEVAQLVSEIASEIRVQLNERERAGHRVSRRHGRAGAARTAAE